MSHYVKKMVKEVAQENLKGASVASPWNESLFKAQHDSTPLEKEQAKLFHTITTHGLFLCKHGCLDTSNSIPNHTGTKTQIMQLCQMLQFLKQTMKDKLTLRADSSGHLKWHCNTAFTLHDDFRSHTGSTFLMGDEAITSLSRKQGMNTRSPTEAEVVATDKSISPMIWTRLFLEAQDIQSMRTSSIRTTKVPCCSRPMDARVLASALII